MDVTIESAGSDHKPAEMDLLKKHPVHECSPCFTDTLPFVGRHLFGRCVRDFDANANLFTLNARSGTVRTRRASRSPSQELIALLAFAQRQIRVSRAHITPNRNRRKHIPTVIKTPGDYIQAKRYEKGLHPYQVAGKMGIETALVLAWESGTRTPDEKQWQLLSDLLSFDSGVDFPIPHRGRLLGFTQSKS